MYPFICSVRSSYKMEHGRGPGKQSFLYSQVPERQSLVAWGGHKGRVHPGSGLCQVGGEERERRGGWTWGPVPFLRFRESTERRVKGDLNGKSECPVVTVRGGEESNWWQGQPSHWCTWPSWWDVYTLWGCSDSRKVWSFKIYSTDSQVWGFFF